MLQANQGAVKYFLSTLGSHLYACLRGVRNIATFSRQDDHFGTCNICGRSTFFRYRELFPAGSPLTEHYENSDAFRLEINAVNSMDCSWCLSKFRVRAAAETLLRYFGPHSSIKDFIKKQRTQALPIDILETASSGGIFSATPNLPGLVLSEYFPDIPRGALLNGVRSEDLEQLTFKDRSFDLVISLDVFEHIADPWRAFAEVVRVLKPEGIAVVTVPMRKEIKVTRHRAELRQNQIIHHLPEVYHLDPLNDRGVLVFTDFGLDTAEQLEKRGINAQIERFTTHPSGIDQFVLVLRKGRP